MKSLETVLGFESSEIAQFRFHCLKIFYEGGWEELKRSFPNLSRPTLYRWKKSYEDSGKRLNSLVPKSTKPHHLRAPKEHVAISKLIRQLREDYPRMGKMKIELFVKALVSQLQLTQVADSSSSIGRLIKRKNYFFAGKAKGRRVRQDSLKKQRVKACPKVKDTQPGYLQLDGVKFYYLDKYYYFLTAVEIVSKQAWVKLVPTLSSKQATLFLKEILPSSFYLIHTTQTDNGSEFKKYFEEALKELKLLHLWSYPRSPKTNGYVERFNWTIQDEFLFSFEDYLLYPDEFREKLIDWLVWYNTKRPHQSLNYLTPLQYYQKGGLSQK